METVELFFSICKRKRERYSIRKGKRKRLAAYFSSRKIEVKLQRNCTLHGIEDRKIVNDLRLKTNVFMNLGDQSL